MLKIRRSRDRLIFNIGIPIPDKDGLYIEMGPWCLQATDHCLRQCCARSMLSYNISKQQRFNELLHYYCIISEGWCKYETSQLPSYLSYISWLWPRIGGLIWGWIWNYFLMFPLHVFINLCFKFFIHFSLITLPGPQWLVGSMFGLNVRPHWTTANWAAGTCLCGHSSNRLTHWGGVTHICISKLTIIGSDNGLLSGRAKPLSEPLLELIGPLWTNFSGILIGIETFSFKKMHLKMSSAEWCPFCLGALSTNLSLGFMRSCGIFIIHTKKKD